MSAPDAAAAQAPLILTFDVGTQSARVVLVDPDGCVLDKVKKAYETPYYSLHSNWAEQDPEVYWRTMCQAAKELCSKRPDLWPRIIAVTCTCIRGTAVCMDRYGRPIRDAIVWLDKRRTHNLPPLTKKTAAMFKVARLTEVIHTLRTHMYCNWLAINEPETWARTEKYALLSTYFNVKFTGILKDSSANMCGILPYDTKNHTWYPKRDFHRELYLVEDRQLIPLVRPGTVLGTITGQAAAETGVPEGLPYIVTGSDKMAETLGLSCTENTTAAISLGTLCSIQIPSKRFFNMQVILPPFPSLTGEYLNEVQTYRGFWLVSWFKQEFAQREMDEAERLGCLAEDLLDRHLAEIPPGCDGLMLQPTLTADALTPHSRGVFLGLVDKHTRYHFYRAIVEGIGFTLYAGLKSLEKAGRTTVKTVFIAGGGSNSPEICQIMSDVLGLPVCRIQTDEASGLGSSLLGFVTMGVYKNVPEALAHMVHEKDRFEPNEKNHALYERLFSEVYCKVFPKLVKLYVNIDHIVNT